MQSKWFKRGEFYISRIVTGDYIYWIYRKLGGSINYLDYHEKRIPAEMELKLMLLL